MANEMVGIEVCYAPPPPAAPLRIALQLVAGTTLAQALEASGIEAMMQPQSIAACKLGIWGKLKPSDTVLRERDRIELYRPLVADPKEARRHRAAKKTQQQP